MKTKIVVGSLLLMLTGCTSVPKLSGYEGPQALATADVIKYNKDCTGAGMRPNVEYVVKRTDSGKVLINKPPLGGLFSLHHLAECPLFCCDAQKSTITSAKLK